MKGQGNGEKKKQKKQQGRGEEQIEGKRNILYFPSTSDVQPCPGKQGIKTCSGCSGGTAPFPTATPCLLLSVAPGAMECPFGWFRSAALSMSPPHHRPPPLISFDEVANHLVAQGKPADGTSLDFSTASRQLLTVSFWTNWAAHS